MRDIGAELFGTGNEEVRIGLGVAHQIAGDHHMLGRIDAKRLQHRPGGAHAARGGDAPGDFIFAQMLQEFARARQHDRAGAAGVVVVRMQVAQFLAQLVVDLAAQFAGEGGGEEIARHADAAVDAPDRNVDVLVAERPVPGHDVVIDAVDEGAVEIEEEGCLGAG